jgi:hypothetical protein
MSVAHRKVEWQKRVPDVVPPETTYSDLTEGKNKSMSAFNEYGEELKRSEQMYGVERGRLAVSLDRITNAMVLVGQHGVYCTSQRNPTVPAMDIRMITLELANAKELLQSVMEELRRAREAGLPGTKSNVNKG